MTKDHFLLFWLEKVLIALFIAVAVTSCITLKEAFFMRIKRAFGTTQAPYGCLRSLKRYSGEPRKY